MGLLDPRNVITPLTNKVNLTTIVLGALLFVTLRWSGASLTVERRETPHPKQFPAATVRPEQKPAVPSAGPEESQAPSGPDELDDLYKDLKEPVAPWDAGKNGKTAAPAPAAPTPAPGKKHAEPEDLNDIEKWLDQK